jgi:hypothetical protein
MQELDQGPSRNEKLRLENNQKNNTANFRSSHTKNCTTHQRCKEMIFQVQTKLQPKHGGHRPPSFDYWNEDLFLAHPLKSRKYEMKQEKRQGAPSL